MRTDEDLHLANRRAGVAEVCWSDAHGSPRGMAVVPLNHEGRPALALYWSQWPQARELASCPRVAWLLSDRRMAQRGWQPVVGFGRMRLIADHDGSVFTESMLDQELRKHPPSRAFADSHLLRREHWWFLPRLILVLEPTEAHEIGERTDPATDGILTVSAADGALAVDTVSLGTVPVDTVPVDAVRLDTVPVDTVRLDTVPDGPIACISLGGQAPPLPGRAALLQHDFSVPDLERWGHRITSGRWDGEALAAVPDPVSRPLGPLLPPTLSVRERLRRHRELERDICRALRGGA